MAEPMMGWVLGAKLTGHLVPDSDDRVVEVTIGVPESAIVDLELEDPVVVLPVALEEDADD